jgi:uncharacterized protein (TIGR03435 family)
MSVSWSKTLLFFAAMCTAAMPSVVCAQSPVGPIAVAGSVMGANGKPLAFAVASVRKNVSGTGSCDRDLRLTADGFRMTGCPLIAALLMAYVPAKGGALGFATDGRIVGAPAWMSDRYDIDARIDEADMAAWQKPTTQQQMLHGMMQSLLAERCKLAAHREMRNKPIYALVVAKSGLKLQQADSVIPAAILAKHPNAVAIPGGGGMVTFGTHGSMELYGASMETLALVLANKAGRPVVDKTGLTTAFDIKLEMPQPGPPAADGTQDPGPSIFTLVQEQLGLKLEPAQDAVETLVIDHIEQPTEND